MQVDPYPPMVSVYVVLVVSAEITYNLCHKSSYAKCNGIVIPLARPHVDCQSPKERAKESPSQDPGPGPMPGLSAGFQHVQVHHQAACSMYLGLWA